MTWLNFVEKSISMETLKGGMLITPKEIQLLTDKHYKTCQKEHLAIRDALGKKSRQLSVQEYCDYNQLDYGEVVVHLNKYRK